jgi:hypothetical protein
VIWGGAPAQHLIVETTNAGSGGRIVTGDFAAPISALARQIADRDNAVEGLAGKRGEQTARIEEVASERFDSSLFVEALAGRLVESAIPAEPGARVASDRGILADVLVVRRGDAGAPVEALGAADISVTSNATLPIEGLSQQHSDGGMALEDVAAQRIEPEVPTGALRMLVQEGGKPIEWLTSGARAIGDTAVGLEWEGTAPPVVTSLETGPGRIRLLATSGRRRLLRRN